MAHEPRFHLKAEPGNAPTTGEGFGAFLIRLADAERQRQDLGGVRDDHPDRDRLATLYILAAEAYDNASDATLGHNRAERYEAIAYRCRAAAELLDAQKRAYTVTA